ncbi:DUF916 domain-containing protein [Patescibacteria group bacterium]|nr:DUF916 domain-containing protein [Patescibacteria group bacterium]
MSSLTFRLQFVTFALFAMLLMPGIILAQTATTTPTASTTPVAAPVPDTVLPDTYRIEQLFGDEVVGDFVVGPGKVELQIAPGQSKTVTISVSNRTGAAKLFKLEMEDAAGSQDPNTPIVLLGEQTGPYTMKDFIRVADDSFIIEHNKRVQIPVTITLPVNAEPGGLYGSLLVTTSSLTPETESGAPRSAIVSRIGTLFFITVPGAVERSGEMIDFSTVPEKKFYTKGPVTMGVLFENTGSMHLNPYGSITVKNTFGEEVGFVEIEPWFVMPKSLRLREITWDRELLFGRYAITAEINRGYDDVVDTKVMYIWVLPWPVMLGLFTTVFLMFIFIKFIASRFEFKRKSVR